MRKPFFWKRKQCWYVWIDGKQVRLDEDESDAYEMWSEMAKSSPVAVRGPLPTVAEAYLSNFNDRVESGSVTEGSYARVGRVVAAFCREYRNTLARDIKRYHLTEFLKKQKWSVHQVRYAIGAISAMMQWAMVEELVEKNPFAKYPKPPAPKREHLISSEDHAKLMTCDSTKRNPEFRQVLIALKHCGGRSSVICNANIEESDAARWIIHEHKTKKKSGRPLAVYLSPCLSTLSRIASHGRKDGPVFLNKRKERWTTNAIQQRFSSLREKLAMPAGTMAYAYRHTFITSALVAGVDVATVAELVGHADTSMISKHYGHLSQHHDHLAKAAKAAITVRGPAKD